MIKFYCDRCRVEIKAIPHDRRTDYYRIKKVNRFDDFFNAPDRDTTTVHLCDNCQKELDIFINGYK